MDAFQTTYTTSYPKHANLQDLRCEQRRPPNRNCISDSFRTFLKLSDEKSVVEPFQYHLDFLDRNPKLKLLFGDPINERTIREHLKTCTTYSKDYRSCDVRKQEVRPKVKLEDDVDLPLTTYASRFRNPVDVNSAAYVRREAIVPATSLGYERRLARRAKTLVGESEYVDRIGRLGNCIIERGLLRPAE